MLLVFRTRTADVLWRSLLALTCALATATAGAQPAGAEPIRIGRILPLSGPIGPYGKAKQAGADALIAAVNAQGGIGGRKLEVTTLDDVYDPKKAEQHLRSLAQDNRTIAVLGLLGIPVVGAMLPIIEELRLPTVGLTSGSDAVRTPFRRYAFPVRASYADEASHTIEQLATVGVTQLAIVAQADVLGRMISQAYLAAMQKRGIKPVAVIELDRDQPDTKQAIAKLQKSQPQAVLLALTFKPAAALLRPYRDAGGTAQLYASSVISATQLQEAAGAAARGVAISQVFPVPTKRVKRIVNEYLEAINATGAAASYYGLEGYVEAKVLVEGLRRAQGRVTRESLVASLESLSTLDLGDLSVSYGPASRVGSRFVTLTILGAGGRILD